MVYMNKPNYSKDTEIIDLLLKKLDELEKLVKDKNNEKTEYNITINELHISDPILKELSFQLESLDIKELSGTLNIGNNISPKNDQKKQS